jgi:hypothetical protein
VPGSNDAVTLCEESTRGVDVELAGQSQHGGGAVRQNIDRQQRSVKQHTTLLTGVWGDEACSLKPVAFSPNLTGLSTRQRNPWDDGLYMMNEPCSQVARSQLTARDRALQERRRHPAIAGSRVPLHQGTNDPSGPAVASGAVPLITLVG